MPSLNRKQIGLKDNKVDVVPPKWQFGSCYVGMGTDVCRDLPESFHFLKKNIPEMYHCQSKHLQDCTSRKSRSGAAEFVIVVCSACGSKSTWLRKHAVDSRMHFVFTPQLLVILLSVMKKETQSAFTRIHMQLDGEEMRWALWGLVEQVLI